MKKFTLLVFGLLGFICYSYSQPGKLNLGINFSGGILLGGLPNNYENVSIVKPTGSMRLSLKYFTHGIVSFHYQIGLLNQSFEGQSSRGDLIKSNNSYLMQLISLQFKVNKSKERNTSIAIGFRFLHARSEEYIFSKNPGHYPPYIITPPEVYNSNDFHFAKSGLVFSLSRETTTENKMWSIFREIYYLYEPLSIINKNDHIFYSDEIGITLGFAYNFKVRKKP